VLPDGILEEVGIGLDAQRRHDAVLVEGNGAGLNLEDTSHLLHRKALCEQLQHLSLTFGDSGRFWTRFLFVEEESDSIFRD